MLTPMIIQSTQDDFNIVNKKKEYIILSILLKIKRGRPY